MKLIKLDKPTDGKAHAVVIDTGAIIKAFYDRADARDFLDWISRHPAAEDAIIDKA